MEQFIFDIKSSKNNESFIDLLPLKGNLSIPSKNLDNVLKIVVEGNIGSGKTTFLSIFDRYAKKMFQNPMVLPEPVDNWRDVEGVNIFQLLSDDPIRWSFTFQSYVQFTMLLQHNRSPDNGNVKIMERSLYSARYCFVENLFQKQLISPVEYTILDNWFNICQQSAPVDLIIYLRTDPDVVFERIHRRGRPEESKITLDYIRSLHQLHEDWLINEKYPLPAPVISIDANIPLEQILSVYEEKTNGILKQHQHFLVK